MRKGRVHVALPYLPPQGTIGRADESTEMRVRVRDGFFVTGMRPLEGGPLRARRFNANLNRTIRHWRSWDAELGPMDLDSPEKSLKELKELLGKRLVR